MISYPSLHIISAYSQSTEDESFNTTLNPSKTALADTNLSENMYFQKGCHFCHSNVGQGARSGKRIVEPLLPKDDFFAVIRRPYGKMPAYSPKVLSDSELAEIYNYLASLNSHEVEDIPLLKRFRNEGKE